MANAEIDQNGKPTLTALSNAQDGTIVQLWADPVLHALLTTSAAGTGTVTSVSVATANGFSGTVVNATTTPAITIIAGAIIPTSVNGVVFSGSSTPTLAVTGTSTISGSNTGDQTITLTGNVTGSGTGSFPTTIASSVALAGSPTTTTQSPLDNSTKIATTAYTDTAVANAVSGVNPAIAVSAATTAAGNTSTWTYNNGASGIGATFTGPVNIAIVIDGITFSALTQSLLIKNDTQSPSGAFNGIYNLTTLQTGISGAIFTRRLDFDTPSDMNNTGAIPVVGGTANGSTSWIQTANIVTVGTTPLVFQQFSINPSTVVTAVSVATANGFSGSSSGGTTPALTIVAGAITPTTVNGNTFTTGSSTYTGTAAATYTFPASTASIARTDAAQTFTGTQTFSQVVTTANVVSVTSNAGTVPVTSLVNNFTNSSASAMTITMTTTSAVDGQSSVVRIYDSTGVAKGITWVNTENSANTTAPANSAGSTTIPLSVGFKYNSATSKWTCLAFS